MKKIKQASVIGSGVMGSGIAALLASAGIRTLLLDIIPYDLKDNEKNNQAARNRIVQFGLNTALKAKPAVFMQPMKEVKLISIGNLEDDFDRLSECDWIIEAVVENTKIKQDLFARIEKVRKPDAIISSNTSGIPLKLLSKGRSREFRQHFLGTHFFNPVRYMKLLEVISGEETRPEILKFIAEFSEKTLGKGIVWAKDTPGFIANRIGIQGIITAMQLMEKYKLRIPETDALFGPLMGRPKTAIFKTLDLVGLDVLGHVAVNLYKMLPHDEQRESFKLPDFINKMIDKKLLGNKTKKGFYKKEVTSDGKTIRKVIDPVSFEYAKFEWPVFPCMADAKHAQGIANKIKAIIYGKDKGSKYARELLADGFIYAINRIPEIADIIVEIDNAMKWGFNFEIGPFETWDAVGLKEFCTKMEADGFKIPEKIKNMLKAGHNSFYTVKNGKNFYYDFNSSSYKKIKVNKNVISLKSLKTSGKTAIKCKSASLIDIGNDVFCLEFNTKMNILNAEIIDFMEEVINYTDKNGAGLVIGNQSNKMPGAFSAGADLSYMLGLAKEKKWDAIEAFLTQGQSTIIKAKYSAFPVVAAPYGLTLGGACEICLGADRIVAHSELYMGLVEVGVGLLPAGSGSLNFLKKLMNSISESINIEPINIFLAAFKTIATARVSTSAADAKSCGFLDYQDRIIFNRDYLIGEAKKEVLKMVDEGYTSPVKQELKVAGQGAQGMVNAELFNMIHAKFISKYDDFVAKKVAFVLSGGHINENGKISENGILSLERQAFIELIKQEKTLDRIEYMLKTGRPLRN
ncbi:putative 3-hydroxyacyl-CoA dehydrogenase [Candidatus Magnetomoraceae bacterium gMMP-13]